MRRGQRKKPFPFQPSTFILQPFPKMSTEKEPNSHTTAWITALVLVPVLYVLSIGPVDYLYWKGRISIGAWQPCRKFYTPFFWLRNDTPLQKPLKAYEKWWFDLAQKP